MKMEFQSSVTRMASNSEEPIWRPVSTTDRTAACPWHGYWSRGSGGEELVTPTGTEAVGNLAAVD